MSRRSHLFFPIHSVLEAQIHHQSRLPGIMQRRNGDADEITVVFCFPGLAWGQYSQLIIPVLDRGCSHSFDFDGKSSS
jgi:hypothetical protein